MNTGCTPAVSAISMMASSWNIPHITYVGTHKTLGDKNEFSTLTRLSYNMNLFAKFYIEVFKAFHWHDIANMYDIADYLPSLVGQSIQVRYTVEVRNNSYYITAYTSLVIGQLTVHYWLNDYFFIWLVSMSLNSEIYSTYLFVYKLFRFSKVD